MRMPHIHRIVLGRWPHNAFKSTERLSCSWKLKTVLLIPHLHSFCDSCIHNQEVAHHCKLATEGMWVRMNRASQGPLF